MLQWKKISRGMKGPVSVDLSLLHKDFTITSSPVPAVNDKIMLDLHHAITERHRIRIRYYSANRGKEQDRTIDPYHLYNIKGDWYLVGFDSLRKSVLNFHVARIRSLTILPEKFEGNGNFSPKKSI